MSRWSLYYHFVWGTKGRESLINPERETLLQRGLRATCQKNEIIVHAIGMMADHLHLAASVPPELAIAKAAQLLKGSSTAFLNRSNDAAWAEKFAWQHEYGVFSFSERSLDDVVAYVLNQKEHHANNQLIAIYEPAPRRFESRPQASKMLRACLQNQSQHRMQARVTMPW
jgi:putative transposase